MVALDGAMPLGRGGTDCKAGSYEQCAPVPLLRGRFCRSTAGSDATTDAFPCALGMGSYRCRFICNNSIVTDLIALIAKLAFGI